MASFKNEYLLAYNGISGILWFFLLVRVAIFLPIRGHEQVFNAVSGYARWIQTLALAEVIHSATGIVRAPLFTTLMQVSSRLFLVHAIVAQFPNSAGRENVFYSSMLIAWAVTEVIRYSFFVQTVLEKERKEYQDATAAVAAKAKKDVNTSSVQQVLGTNSGSSSIVELLTWLRYNTFFVLYPIGIASEVMCIWRAMGEMKSLARGQLSISGAGLYGLTWWACVLVLAIYVPGSWILYTYMMAQRRKVTRAAKQDGKENKKTR